MHFAIRCKMKSIRDIFLSRRITDFVEALEKFSYSYLNRFFARIDLLPYLARYFRDVFKSFQIKRFTNGDVFKLASECNSLCYSLCTPFHLRIFECHIPQRIDRKCKNDLLDVKYLEKIVKLYIDNNLYYKLQK